jgi:Protein of unknown function (DUF4240)
MLRSDDFSDLLWELLEQAQGNDEELKKLLSDKPKETIREFHEDFREAEDNLWSSPQIAAILWSSGLSEGGMSDVITSVVGRGRRYYDEILDHPDRIPRGVPSREARIGGVAGSVYWERFRLEINIPDDEQTPCYGVSVSLAIPLQGAEPSEEEKLAQSAILEDLKAAGLGRRSTGFSLGPMKGMWFGYIIEDLPAFQRLCEVVVSKHLPGRKYELKVQGEIV